MAQEIPCRAMSALGQKQIICAAKSDVRFTPNSDRESGFLQRSCPLCPRKRTCAVQLGMSALGHKRTSEQLRQVRK